MGGRGSRKERGTEGMREKERERDKERRERKRRKRRRRRERKGDRQTDRQAYLANTNFLAILAQKLSWTFQPH